ncbi:MAG: hypothetical protein ACYDHY_13130 [Acidiferrobacterales bacterium]
MKKRMSHEIAAVAADLLRRGLSAPIVAVETGITECQAKRLRQTLGLGIARRGVLRETASILANDQGRLEIALFAAGYRRLGGDAVLEAVQIDAMLRAHDMYIALRRAIGLPARGAINLNEAWIVARDARSGVLLWRSCNDLRCKSVYVVSNERWTHPKISATCPVCKLEHRRALGTTMPTVAPTAARKQRTALQGLVRPHPHRAVA